MLEYKIASEVIIKIAFISCKLNEEEEEAVERRRILYRIRFNDTIQSSKSRQSPRLFLSGSAKNELRMTKQRQRYPSCSEFCRLPFRRRIFYRSISSMGRY